MRKIHKRRDGRFECYLCHTQTSYKSTFLAHFNNFHVKGTLFKCQFCSKAFSNPKSLQKHIAMHSGEGLYRCAYCEKTFKLDSKLDKHMERRHTKQWQLDRQDQSLTFENLNGSYSINFPWDLNYLINSSLDKYFRWGYRSAQSPIKCDRRGYWYAKWVHSSVVWHKMWNLFGHIYFDVRFDWTFSEHA